MSRIYLHDGIEASLINPSELENPNTTFRELKLECRRRDGRLIIAQKMMQGQPILDQIKFMDGKAPFYDIGTWHDIRVAVNPAFLEPFFKVLENYTGISIPKVLEENPAFRIAIGGSEFSTTCMTENMLFENGTITSRQFMRSNDPSEKVVESAINHLHWRLGNTRYEPEYRTLDNGHLVPNPKYPKAYPPEPGFGKGFKDALQILFWRNLWMYCEEKFFTHTQRQYMIQARVLGEFKYTDNVPDFIRGGYGSFMIKAPIGTKDSFTYDGKDVWAIHVDWREFREGKLELKPWMDADPSVETQSQPVLPDQPDQTEANPDLANPKE